MRPAYRHASAKAAGSIKCHIEHTPSPKLRQVAVQLLRPSPTQGIRSLRFQRGQRTLWKQRHENRHSRSQWLLGIRLYQVGRYPGAGAARARGRRCPGASRRYDRQCWRRTGHQRPWAPTGGRSRCRSDHPLRCADRPRGSRPTRTTGRPHWKACAPSPAGSGTSTAKARAAAYIDRGQQLSRERRAPFSTDIAPSR